MKWEITKDYVSGDTYHPKTIDEIVILKKVLPHEFRLYDDDGELYYEGLSDDQSTEDAFQPLDHYTRDGCTDIKYLEANGIWRSL